MRGIQAAPQGKWICANIGHFLSFEQQPASICQAVLSGVVWVLSPSLTNQPERGVG